MPKEVELVHCKCLESRLDQLTSAMTSLTERLMGKSIGQVMEYKEELVHNVLTAAQTAVVSVAKKVEDNVLHLMTVLVAMPQSTMLQTPAANPPHALLRVPITFAIK